MVDFLKNNPFVSMSDYKWKLSVPMIRLMSLDNTRVHYLSEKEKEKRSAKSFDLGDTQDLSSLGISVFNE